MTTSIGQRLLDAEMRLLGFRTRAEARPDSDEDDQFVLLNQFCGAAHG